MPGSCEVAGTVKSSPRTCSVTFSDSKDKRGESGTC